MLVLTHSGSTRSNQRHAASPNHPALVTYRVVIVLNRALSVPRTRSLCINLMWLYIKSDDSPVCWVVLDEWRLRLCGYHQCISLFTNSFQAMLVECVSKLLLRVLLHEQLESNPDTGELTRGRISPLMCDHLQCFTLDDVVILSMMWIYSLYMLYVFYNISYCQINLVRILT